MVSITALRSTSSVDSPSMPNPGEHSQLTPDGLDAIDLDDAFTAT
jgi:hypothetical protein